jgi:nitrogen fixation-related uncharacterized protein
VDPDKKKHGKGGTTLSTPAVAGIIGGASVVALAIIALAVFFARRSPRRSQQDDDDDYSSVSTSMGYRSLRDDETAITEHQSVAPLHTQTEQRPSSSGRNQGAGNVLAYPVRRPAAGGNQQ